MMKTTNSSNGLLQALQNRLSTFHHGEGGAVALLCMAALLVLFMIALVLMDSGEGARNKMEAQMGADTAAYSQAAVKARSMNMIAFANIGKRTAVGIHNMYYFQPLMYFLWWAGECGRCCCGWVCPCRITACRNCVGNLIKGFLPFKALFEFFKIIGQKKISNNLKQLTDFQKELAKVTPYWGLGEAMVRGFRNGAHAVGTFPEPKNNKFGGLPVENSGKRRGACLTPIPFINQGPITLGTTAEYFANFQNLKKRSTSKPSIAKEGPRERVSVVWSALACLIVSPKDGAPYILSAKGSSADDLFHKSNFIISYRHNGDLSRWRENYEFVATEKTEGQGIFSNLGGYGSWSLSRSEVYFPEKSVPKTFGFLSGQKGIDLFLYHPGWLGKLRPLTIPNEKAPSGYNNKMMSKGYDEAQRLMFQKADIVELFKGAHFPALVKDKLYGKKVFKGMDGQVGGRLVTDGFGK